MDYRLLTRRSFLGSLVAVPASAVVLAACGGESATDTATTSSTAAAGSEGTASTASTAASGAGSTASGQWASGGTDLISASYPDSTIFESVEACSLSMTESTTEGPCYFSSDTGEDISLGYTGLPTQLCLQLVDESCAPLADHTVEVWHCDVRGIYSGDTSASDDAGRFAGDFCTDGDAEAEASTYFRGQRTTDAEGRVNFKTCFPGWYSGRTIHIHFAVTSPDGTSQVISQFGFANEFSDEICTTHELYADRGVQDTPVDGDNVFPSTGYEEFLLATEQNSDGSLLAYAAIMV